MELFGIGPLELIFIILIAIIILGPKEIEKTAKAAGRGMYRLVRSDMWKTLTQTSRQIRTLPNDLMRQAGIEELQKDLNKDLKDLNKDLSGKPGPVQAQTPPQVIGADSTVSARASPPDPDEPENRIAPPEHDPEPPA
jgi:sec-independent protein translocase protein TatB